jgi:hypothetical protein
MATTNSPYNHNITLSFKSSSGKTISAAIGLNSMEEVNISLPIPANSAAYQLNLSIPVLARLNDLVFLSDQNITLKTNSSGSPANTYVLVAGVPFYWTVSSGVANPVTTPVTAIFVVNSGSIAANLDIIIGQDVIP